MKAERNRKIIYWLLPLAGILFCLKPELRIELNEGQLARYGVAKEDVQSIIEMAIGGKSAS